MPARGLTLIECAVALVVSSVLLAAVTALLLAGWRSAHAQSAELAARQSVVAAGMTLRAELSGISAPAGDIIAMSESAIAIRATRSIGIACRAPAGSAITLADSQLSSTRTVDPSRDSALVFREGDALTGNDDRWLRAGIASAKPAVCPDGAGATTLSLAGLSALDLGGVAAGAPVRTFEILEYRRYLDGSRQWMLGVRGPAAGGGWAATSPIAGPLRSSDGLVLRYYAAGGSPTADRSSVAVVEAAVRSASDSLTFRTWVGGP